MWLLMAVLSALFAGATAILAKCGIRNTDSDLATALRTFVVLLFSWGIVFLIGSQRTLRDISPFSLKFLILSGLSTGASWLCYFKALSLGNVNKVAPIDKSSTILSVLFAIAVLGETDHLLIKLFATVLLGFGTFLMIEKSPDHSSDVKGRAWIIYAFLSAFFAAITSILAKVGITGVESNLGTAIRTVVVLFMAWLLVFVKGKWKALHRLSRKDAVFIVLSGIATGASWLCYHYAIQQGAVSVVVPIDKMSIVVVVFFSSLFLGEKLSRRGAFGLGLMVFGTLLMSIFS